MRKLFDGTRRQFVTLAAAVATPMPAFSSAFEKEARSQRKPKASSETVEYPRRFSGEHLSRIAFPLGGIGTGDLEASRVETRKVYI
jgi:hypothetical protein